MSIHSASPSASEAETPLKLLFIGLTLSSSWGNGHATTYRGLLRALSARGHSVRFLERDVPYYASQRDLSSPEFCDLLLYQDLADLKRDYADIVAQADAVIVGSYVPEAINVIRWVRSIYNGTLAFYDIDTPVTLEALLADKCAYLDRTALELLDLYLSFTGGPALDILEGEFHVPCTRHLPCAVDQELYRPTHEAERYLLGYLGTYSADRQPALEELLLEPARRLQAERFAVAGPQYPADCAWPANVERMDHLPPAAHPRFYGQQRFTLNVTRAAMKHLGYSPSVRLFEAAACGSVIISDVWDGIGDYFSPGREILLCESRDEVIDVLMGTSAEKVAAIGAAARKRALRDHTPANRAKAFERFLAEAAGVELDTAASA